MSELAHAGAIVLMLVLGILIGRITKRDQVITDAGDTHADMPRMLTADSALIDKQCRELQVLDKGEVDPLRAFVKSLDCYRPRLGRRKE